MIRPSGTDLDAVLSEPAPPDRDDAPRSAPSAVRPYAPRPPIVRPRVEGKFLFAGERKLYLRGVTYGPFGPEGGGEYRDPGRVERDFARIAANGLNAIRTYTIPPRWLLETAGRFGLRVMVGLPWEQHVAFLEGVGTRARDVERRVRAGVAACAGHPAVLAYAVGNEIPGPIVRWHGRRRVERFLERLYRAAKAEDPAGLVTYVNYPTTEYLQLPFLDFVAFNVYLESQERFHAYLARLQNLAGERPLVMGEVGLDSRRHGTAAQAQTLERQLRGALAAGCAGAFVFAWTDEWHRGGHDVEDWDFGLTDRRRRPKPALAAVRRALAQAPFPQDAAWPRVSVVVCTHNGARTIRDCLDGVARLEYPSYEVIVVDDGSTDGTAAIAGGYDVRLIPVRHAGLSAARNVGMEAATGEIVAYLDDDARPDPHWLTYLAAGFLRTAHVGIGGPNIAPPGDGPVAECVARAPGGPSHVLLSDEEAEHIPGCNMAFRRAALQAVGGFDPRFRIAGDDVDLCWRLQERGWTLGFSPAAVVWHHRRDSVRAYWRQQLNYGKAEALLERKWPEKYNSLGHAAWRGRLYGSGATRALLERWRVYHGVWGSGLFQSIYTPTPGLHHHLPLLPEWYLGTAALLALSLMSPLWPPLRLALPLLGLGIGVALLQAGLGAARATAGAAPAPLPTRARRWALTAFLHLTQPMARLLGRLRFDLTPWRRRGLSGACLPRPRVLTLWSERWRAAEDWLHSLEAALRVTGARLRCGGGFDRWDLEVRDGSLGATRLLMALEEHGAGRQLVRLRVWPRLSRTAALAIGALAALAAAAARGDAWTACALFSLAAALLASRALSECAAATAAAAAAFDTLGAGEPVEARGPAPASASKKLAVTTS